MTRWRTFRIGPYDVEAAIEPRRTPHVGADSPSYLDIRPGRLKFMRVLRDREDLTVTLEPAERSRIECAVCREAGIPITPAGIQPPARPASFSIREGGQRFIDWRDWA